MIIKNVTLVRPCQQRCTNKQETRKDGTVVPILNEHRIDVYKIMFNGERRKHRTLKINFPR